MEFEWDEEKADHNEQKHGISFPFATRVFLDENRLEWADTRREYGGASFVSSPQERQNDMSVKTTGIVKFTLNPERPPALTKKAKARLTALQDKDIDFSDIPVTYGVAWKRPDLLIPAENKRQITLRIDGDVLAFFKTTGRRYQTRMNEVLRSYMNAQQQASVPRRPRGR